MSAFPPGISAPPPYTALAQGGGGAGSPPKKYIRKDGMMKINPEYKRWKELQEGRGPDLDAPKDNALAVVSNMDDYIEMQEASERDGGEKIRLAPATNNTIDIMQERDMSSMVGLSPDAWVDELGRVLAKYEVPIGLMNKLMMLSELDVMEFIVDDSGSMGSISDTVDKRGRPQTRWEEAHSRIKLMMEVLAYTPSPLVRIRFLNRDTVVSIQHSGQTPDVYFDAVCRDIDNAFVNAPSGRTPAKRRLKESLKRDRDKSVARYFFGDGEPNGGEASKRSIEKMVINRSNPRENPITFLSCTNEDDQVEWMKDLEEIAPYCAEYDDYHDEANEVRRDQGDVLPFTRGFHLIGQLVAAMNPDDLDAMDESVPLTKPTLDNLLGLEHNETEYRHYFDGFLEAQRIRTVESPQDEFKKTIKWERCYHDFLVTPVAKNIDAVKDFRRKLARVK